MDKNKNPLNEKFKKDKLSFARITNKDLVCRDCLSRFNDEDLPCNTSKCAVFEIKPSEVLNGEDCDFYENEKEYKKE